MAELRAFEPSWRDRLAGWMMGNERATPERRRFVEGLLGSSGLGNTGVGLVDVTPVGGLLGAQEAARDGDYRGAAMNAMFLGPAAKTANKVALKVAEEMAAKGASRDAIWNETGWFKGVDGKWRFEIPDNETAISPRVEKGFESAYVGDKLPIENADRFMPHPQLHEAYPDMWGVNTELQKGGGYPFQPSGYYFQRESGAEGIFLDAQNMKAARDMNLHELQHAVQHREGFAKGGGPEEFRQQKEAELARDALWWRREIASRGAKPGENPSAIDAAIIKEFQDWGAPEMVPPPTVRQVAHDISGNPEQQLDQIVKFYGLDKRTTPYSDRELYNRLAGEVEARNVQNRKDFTPEQRRTIPPWLTQDTPEELQIIRGLLGD